MSLGHGRSLFLKGTLPPIVSAVKSISLNETSGMLKAADLVRITAKHRRIARDTISLCVQLSRALLKQPRIAY
jgi:hypothetical protein